MCPCARLKKITKNQQNYFEFSKPGFIDKKTIAMSISKKHGKFRRDISVTEGVVNILVDTLNKCQFCPGSQGVKVMQNGRNCILLWQIGCIIVTTLGLSCWLEEVIITILQCCLIPRAVLRWSPIKPFSSISCVPLLKIKLCIRKLSQLYV